MYPRVHVLDAGYQYCDTMDWQRAARLVYEKQAVAIVSSSIQLRQNFFLPRVIRLLKSIRRKFRYGVPWSRERLFIRDHMTCMYCGVVGTKSTLSIDHVLPQSRGGKDCWEQTVTACKPCNNKKDNKTPSEARMSFIQHGFNPYTPTVMEFFGLLLNAEGLNGVLDELGIR